MAFLSALALLLSLWIGTTNAITIAYAAWLGQFFARAALESQLNLFINSPLLQQVLQAYNQFWGQPLTLIGISLLLVAAAFWLSMHQTRFKSSLA